MAFPLKKEDIFQFAKYFASAFAAVIVNVASRALLSLWLPFGASVVVAYFIGHIVNYTISVLFVFTKNGKSASPATFLRFTLVACGGLVVTYVVSMLLRALFLRLFPQLPQPLLETAAHVLSTGCSFLCNYVGHILFSFRKKAEKSTRQGACMETSYKIPEGKQLRVAISGKSGCGNTTVSTLLAQRLGVKLVNFTFRQLAAEKNMTLQEILDAAKTDDSYDRAVDTRQVELARQESCVLGSRLAVWMLKEADFKVYLLAEPEVRAARIQKREGGDLGEIMAFTQKRDSEDSARYQKLYQIDNTRYDFCDLVVDTAERTPEQIVGIILEKLAEKKLAATV